MRQWAGGMLVVGAVVIGGVLCTPGVGAKQNRVIRAVPVYDVGNAVEVFANGLEQQGWEVFAVVRNGYYDNGTQRVTIWAKGYGEVPQLNAEAVQQGSAIVEKAVSERNDGTCTTPDPFLGAGHIGRCSNGGWSWN